MQQSGRNEAGYVEFVVAGLMLATLAAVVTPHLSDATALGRSSDPDRGAQLLRHQIARYRLEHHDRLPGGNSESFDANCFWKQLTCATDDCGNIYDPHTSKSGPFGPYRPNLLTDDAYASGHNLPVIRDGMTDPPTAQAGTNFYFNFADHSGKLWPAIDSQGTRGQ